jgi:NAD(P)-dependent dehydrogenase (short-subunit alcohol dehydrogenase family)
MQLSKGQISSQYTEAVQAKHLSKPYKEGMLRVLLTGAESSNSIGEGIVRMLLNFGHTAQHIQGDVRDQVVENAIPSWADALIMCHGVSWLDWLENAPDSKIRECIDVNLYGTINLTKAFVRSTIETPHRKKIIAIGSMAYNRILNGSATYCASKAGVAHFIRCAAWELAPKGYDVYCIHPSNVDGTPMANDTIVGLARYRGITMEEAESYWSNSYIRLRSLKPYDIASLVIYLLSPEAEFLSGQQFEMTGGQR